jgi:hypothetical protein
MTATPSDRQLPTEASVVEVYGSTFLLEWLDLAVLASAAAHSLPRGGPVAATGQRPVARTGQRRAA